MKTVLVAGLVALAALGCGGVSRDGNEAAPGVTGGAGTPSGGGAPATGGSGTDEGGAPSTSPGGGVWDEREVLATLQPTEGVSALLLDDERVYAVVSEHSAGDIPMPVGARLAALPKAGGKFQLLGPQFPSLGPVHQEGAFVFVASPDEDEHGGTLVDVVSAIAKSNGALSELGTADSISAIAANDDAVFVACLGGAYGEEPSIQRFDRETGEKTPFWSIDDVAELAATSDELYLVTRTGGLWRRGLAADAEPVQVSDAVLPTGAMVTFAASRTDLVWLHDGLLGSYSLLDGALSQEEYSYGGVVQDGLAAGASGVVWAELDAFERVLGVVYKPLDGAEAKFAAMPAAGLVFAADATHVYGANSSELWRLPLSALAE